MNETNENERKPLVPLERWIKPPVVTEEQRKLLDGLITRMIRDGWNDMEIAYDINRINGVSHEETGQLFTTIHLVALLRDLYGLNPGDPPEVEPGAGKADVRPADQPAPDGL